MKNRKYRDKDWLKEKYLNEKMTITEISEASNSGTSTIWRWLHKYGIETRDSRSQMTHHINLTSFEQQFLDGLMLGDGGMDGYSKSARYYHSDTFEDYIHWLSGKLSQIKLENSVGGRPDGYYVRTRCYQELSSQYDEWYPTGGKKVRIPGWVEVTPITLFNWFIGDGSYFQNTNGSWILKIRSTTFEEGLPKMINQIKDLGISCGKIEGGIKVYKESHRDFFDYISSSGTEIPPGYEYKFPEKYRQKIGDYDE